MVSIHKVPVIVYLIIRVISSTFRFKREAHPLLASRFKAPENCPCCRNEQLRTSRRYMYIKHYTPIMPMMQIHHRLIGIMRDVLIQHTQRHSLLLCSWQHWCFLRTSNGQHQSVRIRHYLYVRPHHLYFFEKSRHEDIANVRFLIGCSGRNWAKNIKYLIYFQFSPDKNLFSSASIHRFQSQTDGI